MAQIRLLQRNPNGDIVFRNPSGTQAPVYAILSHTWEQDEEVTFRDMEARASPSDAVNKKGWRKIQFCAEQAAADGLQYFWIDTCCIDKSSSAELSAAINSMYRWYQNSARCYVYLSDVSKPELIAPRLVDFFSSEGQHLGDKLSLELQIRDITGIPETALRGGSSALSKFSIEERRSWVGSRETTIEEDEAYCLIGIFQVSMPAIYGEGKERAFQRLEREIQESVKGISFEQYTVGLNLNSLPGAVQFVGRKHETSEMYELLDNGSGRSAVVLHGLGGIGKTQLARTYIVQNKHRYTSIFWLNANDEDSLKLSFRDIAKQVLEHLPETRLLTGLDLDNLDRVTNSVKAWFNLRENKRWLMVFDNYDNPLVPGNTDSAAVDIDEFLPQSDQGSIIITTRSSQVSQGHPIHVQLLDTDRGLQILSNTSGRKDIEHDSGAIELVNELDGLPLAIATAGTYLKNLATSFADYLRLYRTSWLRLQATSPQLTSYKNRSLYTTWQITFGQIERQNSAAAALLKLWAYLDKQDVWFDLLQCEESANHPWIGKLTEDELSFNEAVNLLCNFGLVNPNPSSQRSGSAGYSMHSCVHSWSEHVLNRDFDESLAHLALICLAFNISSINETRRWIMQRRLLPHAIWVSRLMLNRRVDHAILAPAFTHLGNLFGNQSKLTEADKMFTKSLRICEELLGPRHEFTLATLTSLGTLYTEQGRLTDAEALLTRTLQGTEEAFGLNHELAINVVQKLGYLYRQQGRMVDAELLTARAFHGWEAICGPKCILALQTINNLGNIYAEQGKLAEAEEVYKRALQGYEEVLRPKDVRILDTTNNLGTLYLKQGRLAEAEDVFKQALQGEQEALEQLNITTVKVFHILAILRFRQGRMLEAEELLIRAVQGYEDVVGPLQHLPALEELACLGGLFAQMGRVHVAKDMYDRALIGYRSVQGPSSALCREIEQWIQELQMPSSETPQTGRSPPG